MAAVLIFRSSATWAGGFHFSDAVIDYQLNLSLPFNSRVHADVASHIPPQVREAQKQWLRAEQGPSSIRDISGS